MVQQILIDLGAIIGLPILRNVLGWIENALADKVITAYEWKELVSTIIRVGLIGTATYFSLNGLGINIDGVAAGFSAILADMIFNVIKKAGTKQ